MPGSSIEEVASRRILHNSRSKMIQCIKRNGKYDGSGIEFFFPPCENHQLMCMWVNGMKLGEGSIFLNTGDYSDLFLHGTFVDDELNGLVQLFYESSGNVKMEGNAKDGMWDGLVKEYDEEGKVVFEGEYVNGLRHGNGVENGQKGVWKEGIQIDGAMADQMKLSEYVKEIERLKSEVATLRKEILLLNDENKNLKKLLKERSTNVPITKDTKGSSAPEVDPKLRPLNEMNVGVTKGPINPISKNNSDSGTSGSQSNSSDPVSSSSSSSFAPAPPSMAPKMRPPADPKALSSVAPSRVAPPSPPSLLKNTMSPDTSTRPSPSDCSDVVSIHIDNDYSSACFCGKDGSNTMVKFLNVCYMPTILCCINGSYMCGIENKAFCSICNIMKVIGRDYSDDEVQKISDKCGCPIVDKNGIPMYKVRDGKRVTAVEALSEIMKYIKEMAEKQSGNNKRRCVLTVPFWFDSRKRECVMEAAEMAYLRVISIVNAHAAAAFYLTHSLDVYFNGNVLVCELTSSSFDVSLVQCNGEEVCTRSFGGTDDMGYEDMIMDMCMSMERMYSESHGQELFSVLHGKSLSRSKARLLQRCEAAFDDLSSGACENPIVVDDDGFEINSPKTPWGLMFDKSTQLMLNIIDRCIERRHISKLDVRKVVWVCRKGFPFFMRDRLQCIFGNDRIVDSSSRDSNYDAIVRGAMKMAKLRSITGCTQ